jgi:hypothetical protein
MQSRELLAFESFHLLYVCLSPQIHANELR